VVSKVVVTWTYHRQHPKSAATLRASAGLIPGGVTHEGRHMKPFPVYVDADGLAQVGRGRPRLRGFWMGHARSSWVHCHTKVVTAIQDRPQGHPLRRQPRVEVRWAEMITRLIPLFPLPPHPAPPPSPHQLRHFPRHRPRMVPLASRAPRPRNDIRIARALPGRKHVGSSRGTPRPGPMRRCPRLIRRSTCRCGRVPESVLDQPLVCPPNDSSRWIRCWRR